MEMLLRYSNYFSQDVAYAKGGEKILFICKLLNQMKKNHIKHILHRPITLRYPTNHKQNLVKYLNPSAN